MKRSVAADHMKRVLAAKIADLPTADLLIISFYEVGRRAFGSRVGQKSFRETGLYPYNPELIRALADQFHGYLGGAASMPQQCIAVCTETINLRLAGNKRTATTMQARHCVREQVYGPEELIARSERNNSPSSKPSRRLTILRQESAVHPIAPLTSTPARGGKNAHTVIGGFAHPAGARRLAYGVSTRLLVGATLPKRFPAVRVCRPHTRSREFGR
jgi:hypothetical protein